MLRRLIETAGDIQEMAYAAEDAVDETLDRAEAAIFEVAERRVADSLVPLYPALEETMDQLEALYDRESDIVGTATGYHDLDALLLGHAAVDAHDRRGPSRSGKDVARARAWRNTSRCTARKPVLFFSMEMGYLELTKRLLAAEARVPSRKLQTGKLSEHEWPRVNQAVGRLAEAPFFIDDNPHCTVMEMRAKAPAHQGALRRPRADRRRLPAADDVARKRVENRQVEVSEIVARPEDPRPRARGAGRVRCRSSTANSSTARTSGRCSPTCASRAASSPTPRSRSPTARTDDDRRAATSTTRATSTCSRSTSTCGSCRA